MAALYPACLLVLVSEIPGIYKLPLLAKSYGWEVGMELKRRRYLRDRIAGGELHANRVFEKHAKVLVACRLTPEDSFRRIERLGRLAAEVINGRMGLPTRSKFERFGQWTLVMFPEWNDDLYSLFVGKAGENTEAREIKILDIAGSTIVGVA